MKHDQTKSAALLLLHLLVGGLLVFMGIPEVAAEARRESEESEVELAAEKLDADGDETGDGDPAPEDPPTRALRAAGVPLAAPLWHARSCHDASCRHAQAPRPRPDVASQSPRGPPRA